MDEPADIQARPYGGMFCGCAGLFLFISPARLLATFISRLCCSTCILWWRRRRWGRRGLFSAASKSAGTNNKAILLAPQEGVEDVCAAMYALLLTFAFSPFFFPPAHTGFDLICIFPTRIILGAYLLNTCHLGGNTYFRTLAPLLKVTNQLGGSALTNIASGSPRKTC